MNLLHDNAIVPRLGWMLVHSLWQGIIVAAGLGAMLRVMPRVAAQVRYVVSCMALAVVLFCAMTTYRILGTADMPNQSVIIPQTHTSPGQTFALPMADSSSIPTIADHHGLFEILVISWGFGVVAISLWHLLGWISLLRIRRGKPMPVLQIRLDRLRLQLGIRQAVRLIETARLNVPAVVGAFRPIILLPIGLVADLTPEQVDAILMHELAHVARYDYIVNLMQTVVEALMFYHPAVWWISSQIRC